MTADQGRSQLATSFSVGAGFEQWAAEKPVTRLQRFERLAIRLFGVANALIKIGKLSIRFDANSRSITSMEAAFCDSIELVTEIRVVPDLSTDASFKDNRFITGSPFIRFYAAHPICNTEDQVIGNLILLDYSAREFSDEERLVFADFCEMVQRELVLESLYFKYLEIQKQNRILKREALIDPLLGTWNKTAIIRSLNIEMDRCQKAEKPLSLFIATIDQWRDLKEQFGISMTDSILVKIVSRIRSCVRPFDALGRFGDDLLLIVLPGASHLVSRAVAERIKMAVRSQAEQIGQASVNLGLSIGTVSTDTFPNVNPEQLVALAENALISARKNGTNSVVQAVSEQPDISI